MQPVISVSSVIAQPGGDFLISLTNGTVVSSDSRYNNLHMSNVQPMGATTLGVGVDASSGAELGLRNVSLPSLTDVPPVEPKTPFPGYGAQPSANAAATPGVGIWVKGHTVAIPLNLWGVSGTISSYLWAHTSLRIVPRHQQDWFEKLPERFYSLDPQGNPTIANIDQYGNRFFSIGAGPNGTDAGSCGGVLTQGLNRLGDVSYPVLNIEPTNYQAPLEDRVIETLLTLTARYRNDLGYSCFPPPTGNTYNSNSYTAGLLKAAQVGPPRFPVNQQNLLNCSTASLPSWNDQRLTCEMYPGWSKPVPVEKLR